MPSANKIHHFFECLLPVSLCNLECEYCYIIQQKRREMRQVKLDYDTEHIIRALNKDRLGGVCFFSFCGTGETLMQQDFIPLVHGLLNEGHYVNITNNGTMTGKINDIITYGGGGAAKIAFFVFSSLHRTFKTRNVENFC